MKLHEWLGQAHGRSAQLARFLEVPQSFVSKMSRGVKPIPIAQMPRIETFTNGAVTRKEMLPNGWQAQWPELAARDVCPPPTVEVGEGADA